MKELLAISKEYKSSRPIFRLTMEENSDRIDANISDPIYSFRPEPSADDLLGVLVGNHFTENFSMGRFQVDADDIANKAMEEIRRSFSIFLERNLEMKNPRQSKIVKFYSRNLPNDSDFNDMLICLYKYVRSFAGEDMRTNDVAHRNNAIAVLEAIMEKHDD